MQKLLILCEIIWTIIKFLFRLYGKYADKWILLIPSSVFGVASCLTPSAVACKNKDKVGRHKHTNRNHNGLCIIAVCLVFVLYMDNIRVIFG